MMQTKHVCSYLAVGIAILGCPDIAIAQEWDLGPVPVANVECLSETVGAGTLAPDRDLDGSWRQFRRDGKLTGRSPLIGNITCPEVLWSIDLGARKNWISIKPGAGSSELQLPTTADETVYFFADLFELYGLQIIDMDGDGNGDISPSGNGNHRVGDLLPGIPGFERVACEMGTTPDSAGEFPGWCFLHRWNENDWELLWTSDPVHFGNSGSGVRPIVGDFDDDGEPEVAILPWKSVFMFDLATGTLEKSADFWEDDRNDGVSGRAYGWFGAFDLDNDDRHEFVIVGDFERHITVIGWVNGELQELWDHHIEAGTGLNETIHHKGVNPVADIGADGTPEIVTSIYNESDDQRWHVVARNALNGSIECDLPDRHLAGLGDFDGDGVNEIMFLTATIGAVVPEFGNISIATCTGGVETVLWSGSAEGWEHYEVPTFPAHINTGQPYRNRSVFLRDDWLTGTPVFMTRERVDNGPDITLRLYQVVADEVSEIGSLSGPRLEVTSLPTLNPDLGILIKSITETANEGPVSFIDLDATLEHSNRIDSTDGTPALVWSMLANSVVAPLTPGALPTVISQDYANSVRAFRIRQGTQPEELWRVPGRGMYGGTGARSISTDNSFASVLLADVLGTGDLATIVASESPDSHGTIKAIRADGTTIWATPLNIQGAAPESNTSGIIHWMAGHFTSTEYEDVLVSISRSTYDSEMIQLLDGQSGDPGWQRVVGGRYSDCPWSADGGISSPGGTQMPAFDWDGDGLDEMLDLHNGLFDVYDGNDGSLLLEKWTGSGEGCDNANVVFDESAAADALPAIADFIGIGNEQILFGKNAATLSVLDFNGVPIWHTPFFAGMPPVTLQGIGDMNGDVALDLVSVGHCQDSGSEVQSFAAATGIVRWTFALPEICDNGEPRHVAMGDIDGDGKDEALFTHGTQLYALGENSQGAPVLLWKAEFPNADSIGDVTIGDVDGSGRPQILINTLYAQMYGLGYAGRFQDASLGHWAFEFIETLARSGITNGCGNDNYCPDESVTRAQMAVFLERGKNGGSFSPPAATGSVFLDVGATDFAASFIEQLAIDGITAGCGNNNYCPDAEVSRAQMAVFLLRAKYGSSYSPPPTTGVFGDVPQNHWAVQWIEQLAAENITAGCGGGNYCPEAPVTRDQMAVFLVRTFGL